MIHSSGPYKDANPFRFSTKWFDAQTDLGYWGYRYYSPRLGRWISRDPIGEMSGVNLFAYALNSPFSLVDPIGLSVVGLCECADLIEEAGISSWSAEYVQEYAGESLYRFSTRNSTYDAYLESDTMRLGTDTAREIVHRMLLSPHDFWVEDGKKSSWFKNILARNFTVELALRFSRLGVQFGPTRLNSKYWDGPGLAGPFVSASVAIADLWIHPEEYTLGCTNAAMWIMISAGVGVMGSSTFDGLIELHGGRVNVLYHGTRILLGTRETEDWDWIPGDWGYVKNTGWNKHQGPLAGENIIYLGRGQYFGFGGQTVFRSLAGWTAEVDGWDDKADGSFKIDVKRHYVKAGLMLEAYNGGWSQLD